MKISAKARYGLAAMIKLSENYSNGECTTIISLAERLQISKIYLEQVFSLLKRAELVTSTKGAQGGYQLALAPKEIFVYDILSAIETSLFEKTDSTVMDSAEAIEKTMQEYIFNKLDLTIAQTLKQVSLEDLIMQVQNYSSQDNYMYYL